MWRCPKCGEQVDEEFDACWNCLTERGPDDPSVVPAQSAAVPGRDASPETAQASSGGAGTSGCLTRQEIAQLACRVVALWVFAIFLYEFYGVLALIVVQMATAREYGGGPRWTELLVSGIFPLGHLLVAGLLWAMSRWIARRMVGDDPSPVLHVSIRAEDLTAIAFAAVGVFIFVSAMKDLGGMIYLQTREPDAHIWQTPQWLAKFWGNATGLVLAIWLLMGGRSIVRFLRSFGGPERPDRDCE
jgi:hypothetical protein